MYWVAVKWIPQLFAAFNARWPGRTKAQDGSIGDTAHQAETSGHNPDDTPGVRAERSDADSKPEVRAADVDARGVPMQQVIDGILANPDERKRFIYIIFNGSIWRAANRWRRETYTGKDKHREHAHFSGHPDYDEDGRPFTTILGLGNLTQGDDMALTEWTVGKPQGYRDDQITQGTIEAPGVAGDIKSGHYGMHQRDTVLAAAAEQAAAASRKLDEVLALVSGSPDNHAFGGATHEQLVAAFKEALTDPAVAAVLAQAAFEGAQRAERE